MSALVVPAKSKIALALREPNLLVPNRRPVTAVSPNDRFPNPLCLFVNDWKRPLGKLSGTATSGISINPGYIGNDGTGSFIIDKTEIEGASTLTIVVRHRWLSRTARDGVFGHRTAQGFNLNLGYTNSSQLFLYCGGSGNYTPQFTPVTGAIADNQWVNFVVRFDGNMAAASRVGLWINGLHQSFSWNAAPGTTVPSVTYDFSLCAGNDSSNCEQEIAGIYTRAFSDAVCQEISRNPFILLQAANDAPLLFPVAGGGATDLNADFLASSSVIYQPTLTAGAANLTADFLSSSATIYQPVLGAGPANLAADFLPSASVVYDPSLTAGGASIQADFLASAATVYEPTLAAGAANLVADFLSSGAVIYEPSLQAGGSAIEADFLASSTQIFEPTLAPGAATLFADLLASGTIIYQPTLTGGAANLSADFVSSASVIYQPELIGAGTISADFLASGSQVFEPTLAPGAATLAVDFLSSATALYQPTMIGGAADLIADFLASGAQVYEPSLVDPALLWTEVSAATSTWTPVGSVTNTWTEV